MQNLLSSSLLSKRVKIKIFRSISLRIVLYGCETWSLALRVECRLRVFENRVLRRIFGTKRDGVTGEWRKLHDGELCDIYSSPDIVSVISSRRVGWRGMWRIRTGEVRTRVETPDREHLEDLVVDRRIILKLTFGKRDGALTGLIWIGTGGGLL